MNVSIPVFLKQTTLMVRQCVLKKGLQDLVDNIEEILVLLPLESEKKST